MGMSTHRVAGLGIAGALFTARITPKTMNGNAMIVTAKQT
jgi:hypothetical protein